MVIVNRLSTNHLPVSLNIEVTACVHARGGGGGFFAHGGAF